MSGAGHWCGYRAILSQIDPNARLALAGDGEEITQLQRLQARAFQRSGRQRISEERGNHLDGSDLPHLCVIFERDIAVVSNKEGNYRLKYTILQEILKSTQHY